MYKKCVSAVKRFVKRHVKKTLAVVGIGTGVVVSSTNSASALGLDVSTIAIDNEQVFVLTAIIVAALAAIWPIRKLIKLANRS